MEEDGALTGARGFSSYNHVPAIERRKRSEMARHRILFVDDEENILKSLRRLFVDEGYDIVTANSGEEALTKLDGQKVSLVISDQRMSGMQGVEFLSRIKQLTPHTIGILLTGTADLRTAVDAINSGSVYRYVAKPWDDDECKIIVREAVEKYEIEEKNRRLTRTIRRQNKKLKRLNENLERAKELLTISFERYMSEHLLERILQSSKPVSLSGEKMPVTILISDIRDFTSLAESMTPEGLVKFLNRYFEPMVEIILDNEGVLDKFMGDSVMALFGAIYTHKDDSLRAVRAALEMQEAVERLNKQWVQEGNPPIKVGIGISTGEVVAGNIGSEKRMEFTVIGQDVNYAQRIEGLTKIFPSSILISEPTHAEVSEKIRAVRYAPTEIRGKKEPIVVYGVEGLKTDGNT
ncbi:response regulator [Candidatus Poribacteria bacterium]|nr:response regulator [Candidatus Poribacteria bacterium]